MQRHEFKTTEGVFGAYPRLRRMYPQRQLNTQTIEAQAFALTEYRRDNERFELDVEAELSCTGHSSASCGKTPRSLMDYCLRSPRLCTNGNVLQQFGSARREVELKKQAGARQAGRVVLALRGTFPERLGVLWTILQSELRHARVKRALYDLSLPDLADTHEIRVIDDRQYGDASRGGPDLAARIGTLVFFRLLQSLQRSRNKRGILKLIRQVPSMVIDAPVLALFSQPDKWAPPEAERPTDGSKRPLAGLTAGLRPEGVVAAVLSAAEELMLEGHQLTSEEQGEVLSAMVGLTIKRGSLRSSLRVLRLLLFGSSLDKPVVLQGIGPYLKELETLEPCGRLRADLVVCGDSGGSDPASRHDASVFAEDEDSEGGLLCSLRHRWKQTRYSLERENSEATVSIPAALRGVGLAKVHSTAYQHTALSFDGKLLVWNRDDDDDVARKEARFVSEAGTFPTLLGGSHDVVIWEPGDQANINSRLGVRGCACSTYHLSVGCGHSGGTGQDVSHGDVPVVLHFLADRPTVSDVACGVGHTLALLTTGQVLSWGNGANGRLGLGDTRDQAAATPVTKLQETDIIRVFCGVSHSLAVCSSGKAYSWGKNTSGQCGHADAVLSDQLSPRPIEGLVDLDVSVMAGGWGHTLILTRCGRIYSFGAGNKDERTGQIAPVLGISAAVRGTETEQKAEPRLPTRVFEGDLGSEVVVAIASGWDHCMAVTHEGSLLTWGAGNGGQLGHGDTDGRDLPARVAFFSTPAGGRVCSVAGGREYTAAVTSDGRLFAWGSQRKCTRQRGVVEEGGHPDSHGKGDITPVQIVVPRLMEAASDGNFGRLEVGVSLLRQFERLGLPHVPTDPTTDVDRMVSQAVTAREQNVRRIGALHSLEPPALDGFAVGAPTSPQCGDLNASERQPHVEEQPASILNLQTSTPPHPGTKEPQGSRKKAPPGPLAHIRPSFAPFCVDTSPETFQTFLGLLRDIRTARGLTSRSTLDKASRFTEGNCTRSYAVNATTNAGCKSQLKEVCPNLTGRVGEVRPEDNPCGDSHPGGCPAPANRSELGAASSTVQLEVLRCALRLLRINLFYFVRAASIRRAYHGENGGADNGDPLKEDDVDTSALDDHRMAPDDAEESASNDGGNRANRVILRSNQALGADRNVRGDSGASLPPPAKIFQGTSRVMETRVGASAEGGVVGMLPAPQATISEGSQHAEYESTKNKDGDIEVFIQEIHRELWKLLEEATEGHSPEIAEAIEAVHAEAAECFRVGFSVFYPCNIARVQLLRDIVGGVAGTSDDDGASGTPQYAENNGGGGIRSGNWREPDHTGRVHLISSRALLTAAVEGLGRDSFMAAMVAEALDTEGVLHESEKYPTWHGCGNLGRQARTAKVIALSATELDGIIQSLLVRCVNDLAWQLRNGKPVGVRVSNTSCPRQQQRQRTDSARKSKVKGTGENIGVTENATCPHVRLLLALQTQVIGCWGDLVLRTSFHKQRSPRALAVAHAVRLLEASLEAFTELFREENQNPHPHRFSCVDEEAVRCSFLSIVPLLCVSLAAFPVPGEGRESLAVALLPSLLPMIGVVDRFNRSQEAVECNDDDMQFPPLSSKYRPNFAGWMRGLEETLAALSADLTCGLIENGMTIPHASAGHQLPSPVSKERGVDDICNNGDGGAAYEEADHLVEIMLLSSPFLAHGRENFRSSSEGEVGPTSLLSNPVFRDSRKVIAWGERLVLERRGSSSSGPTSASAAAGGPGLSSSRSSPSMGRPMFLHNVPHRRRRASGDRSEKLNPIDPSTSVASNSSQSSSPDAQTRCSDSVGSLGDESTSSSGMQGGSAESARATTAARQLDSVVDETCAEGFIQNLLCGRGSAQALYQWMAAPPVSEMPVLHATSLATQGQGWGSYQSLSSHSCSNSAPSEDQRSIGAARRRKLSALSVDVDAATRALVGVMIKSNGLVTEAATFAKCRLDRASSPPPALKLVAAAVAEAREAFTTLANSTDEAEDSGARATGSVNGSSDSGDASGHRGPEPTKYQFAAIARMLSAIVRNCDFLLKNPRLPVVGLTRQHRQQHAPCRQKRFSSRLPSDDQQIGRDVADTLRGWASDARRNAGSTHQRRDSSCKNGRSCSPLTLVCQHMAQGQVEMALATASAVDSELNILGCASLESLVVFAASPIAFGALELAMVKHELKAKVRATGLHLTRYLLEDVHISASRRHISDRLARAIRNTDLDARKSSSLLDRPAPSSDISGAGCTATGLVCSSFVELCSFAVCELRDGRSTRDPQDRYRAKDDSLIIILTMLGTLAVKLSPSCLHLGGSIGSEHTPAPGMITEGQLASSSNSRSNKRIPIVPGSGWSARLGIGNSNKSVAAFEANLIPPSALAEQGAVSVIAAVLPVLGAVLSDEGDILAPRTWSPGVAASRHGNVHCAAWRALCVFTTHLCSASMSVRLSERDAISSLGRSTSSNSAEHASKHIAITGGIQQWWQIVQILLSVLFNELTRAQKRLKIVVRRREAEEAVMIATRARLLTAGQVPAPLPAVSGISHLFRQETSAAFAITFWVWAPESAPRAANGGEQSPNAEARMVICTCVQKDWCGGGGGAESQVVLSKLLPSKQRQENANNRYDDERVYVEFAFLKHDNGDASLPTAGRAGDEEGIRLPPGGAVFEESTDRSTETLVVKKFMSGCPLPVGHWTHVCCSYSENEKEIHSRERGGRTQRPCLPVVRISFDGRVVFEQDLPDCNINLRKYQNQGSPGEPAHFEVQVGERNRHLENPPGEMRTGLNVYDIYWHGREISPEQVHILASNGTSQQQDNEQRLAECYVDRLVTLALEIALSSQRAATAMSSSRWLNLWIMTIPVSSLQTQRVVLQALSLLLCTDHLTCGDKTQDANLNSGANADSSFLCPGAPACELDDRVVIDRLCSLLGRSLLSLRDRNLGDYVSRRQNELGKIVIAQERSKEHLSTPQRTRHITIAPRASQESSLISAIVSLLRLLMLEAPTRWRRHVHAALVSGLGAVNAETLVALSNSIPALKTSSTEWYPADGRIETGSLSAARLGAAAAAVYLGGGHIEGPHVGARVSLLPNGYPFVGCFNAADAPVSGAPVGADTLGQGSSTNSSMAMDIVSIGYTSVKCVCGGTLLGVEDLDAPNTGYLGALAVVTVDEEYLGCVDSELDRNTSEAHQSWKRSVSGGKHVQSTMPRRRVIAVDRRQVVWTADVAEPKTPFLFEDAAALSTVSTLLESSCSGRNTCADESIGQPGASRGDAADPSWVNIITAHLQSRLVRALAVQLRHSDLAANAVLGDFLNPLLKLASMPLQSAPTLALGVNGAVAFRRRREFAAVILSFDRQRSSGSSSSRSLLADLEAACQAVWARMSTSTGDPAWSLVPSREGFRACTSNERGVQRSADNGDRSSSSLRPVLQVLGGEAQVDGDRVTAASHFPTVRLSGVGAGLRSAAGRWYYEVTLHTGGLMQLGWAAPPFYCSPVRGQGVGDHVHSWAFDGFRQKRWCVSSAAYGKRWRAGDVVGVLLDAGLQEMRFSLNGQDLGVAFVGFDPEGLYPAASMNVGQAAAFNFGCSPFVYAPAHADEVPFRPIAEAGGIPTSEVAAGDPCADHLDLPSRESRQRLTSMPPVGVSSTEHRARRGFQDVVVGQHRMELSSRDGRGSNGGSSRDAIIPTDRSASPPNGGGGNSSDATRGGMDACEEESAVHPELQRQSLVENLIGMGFPVEWAIRAAESSAGSVMSESAATAWIIEHLEIENTKMEEEMGNMETCEDDFGGVGSVGGRGEHNDEGKAGDDAGFAYVGDVMGMDGNDQRNTRRILGDTGGGWRDIYRQSFLARSNGDSPATASTLQAGHNTQAAEAASSNDAAASIFAGKSADTAAVYPAARNHFRYGASRELLATALSTRDEDGNLARLSVVLETALSILFARAAVVNLLSHIRVSLSPTDKTCPHPLSHMRVSQPGYMFPWWWEKILGKHNCGQPVDVEHTLVSPPRKCQPRPDSPVSGATVEDFDTTIMRKLAQELAHPDCQRRFIDLTKALIACGRDGSSLLPSMSAGTVNTILKGRNEALEDSPHEPIFQYANAAYPMGLLPGSCALAVRSLLQLAANPGKASCPGRGTASLRPLSRQPQENWLSTTRSPDETGDRTELSSFLTSVIKQAVSHFEQCSHMESPTPGRPIYSPLCAGEPGGEREQPTLLWAMWIVETVTGLTRKNREIDQYFPNRTADENSAVSSCTLPPSDSSMRHSICGKVDHHATPSLSVALSTAWSSRAFTAVLLSASSRRYNAALRCSAYSLCASMLDLSLSDASVSEHDQRRSEVREGQNRTETTPEETHNGHVDQTQPQNGGYVLPSQERAVARAFSEQLRSGASMRNLSSPLLKSQLELLVQWQLRKKALGDEGSTEKYHVPDSVWGTTEPQPGIDSPFVFDNLPTYAWRQTEESWDAATPFVAGPGGAGDVFEVDHPTNTQVVGPRRPGTADSEPSALSNLPGCSVSENTASTDTTRMFIETVTATSVTLSWGGWHEDPSDLVAGADGDGSICTTTHQAGHGSGSRASTLVQVLRAKARHAGGRRHGLGVVLKVAAVGLWGAEPSKIAAVDLDDHDCFTVHDLTPDTHYKFSLEQRGALLSGGPPTTTVASGFDGDNSDDDDDDDESCFPPATAGHEGSSSDSSGNPPETDTADGASSAVTGPERSQGGGGSSAYSEGGTDIQTDEGRANGKTSLTSSTRVVAGQQRRSHGNRSNFFPAGDNKAQTYAMDGESWVWHSSRGSRKSQQPCYMSKDSMTGVVGEWELVATVSVATPPAVPFMLDAECCGPNLRLSNSNLTVTNSCRKKWSAVRTTLGFASGVHSWKVRIDRCVSKNVFVGVVSAESKLNNYVGSDRTGWGYLANKAIWHNKSKVRSYGELFREGDTIGVSLDMGLGTLRFARNGRDLGVAVQGLEGMLYPAFSMYNRHDQLTLLPPELHATYTPTTTSTVKHAADGDGGEAQGIGVRSGIDGLELLPADYVALHGTFSAECVIRRATRSLEVLEILSEPRGFESPRGRKLTESILSDFEKRLSGHRGRSLPSSHVCTPVRLDASERARADFFDLGIGDRVLSAEGEATVMGATRHSLWVSQEMSIPPSAPTTAIGQGTQAWGAADVANGGQREYVTSRMHGDDAPNTADATTATEPEEPLLVAGSSSGLLRTKYKTLPWSRRMVRKIISCPEEYVISRNTARSTMVQQTATFATAAGYIGVANGGSGCDENHNGSTLTAAGSTTPATSAELQASFAARWTYAMDDELRRHLEESIQKPSAAHDYCSLDVPSEVLRNLLASLLLEPSPALMTSQLSTAEIRARVALLLHVNDLVLPLLPLLDASHGTRGPLGALVRKHRRLLFTKAKLSLFHSSIETTPEVSTSEFAHGYTLNLRGVKSLPKTAAEVKACFVESAVVPDNGSPAEASSEDFCWVHRSKEVEQSLFGQVARQFCCSPMQPFDGHMAFSVYLEDGPAEHRGASHDQGLNKRNMYRGVFWQVCQDICSPQIMMFARPPPLWVTAAARAEDTHRQNIDNRTTEKHGGGQATTMSPLDEGAVPDPTFTSNTAGSAPAVCMDPIRLEYYRSFGFVVGLAVRTGVAPLPLPRLAPRWWMLVAEDEISARGGLEGSGTPAHVSQAACKPDATKRSEVSEGWGGSSSRLPRADQRSAPSGSTAVDVVLATLRRLQEGGAAVVTRQQQQRLDEILADARFVGPLSNGQVVELLPGGEALRLEQISIAGGVSDSRTALYSRQSRRVNSGKRKPGCVRMPGCHRR